MYTFEEWKKKLIVVRGGGDIATGTIYKLHQSRFPVLVLEIANPSCIRRTISFCEAVFDKEVEVEGVIAKRADSLEEAFAIYEQGQIPVMIDESGSIIQEVHPPVVVDAILAKRNLGTKITDAPAVIGVGPGFCAGKDVDAVIETQRGHNLGRVIYEGKAIANTGVPGMIGGYGAERVIHAPVAGILHNIAKITDIVEEGQPIAWIEGADGTRTEVPASLSGLLRGLIREGYPVTKGFKMADIDPRRKEYENCFTISDKARCIAGGVVEAYFVLKQQSEKGDTQCM